MKHLPAYWLHVPSMGLNFCNPSRSMVVSHMREISALSLLLGIVKRPARIYRILSIKLCHRLLLGHLDTSHVQDYSCGISSPYTKESS